MSDSAHLLGTAAIVAAITLGVLTARLAGAPPTTLDMAIERRVLARSAREKHTLGLVLSGPGYPGFYFPATALLIYFLRTNEARGTVSLIVASVGGWATHRIIKLFARRRRPASMAGRKNEVEAFPSGHTTAATAIAMTTAYVLARQHLVPLPAALAIGLAIPALIGAGRVLADEHWATDVIGGWIGGTGVAALAAAILERA